MNVLVVGASGLIGYEFYRQYKRMKNWFFTYHTHKLDDFIPLDATDETRTKEIIAHLSPDIVILPAAMPDVNRCETDRDNARKNNVGIVQNVIRAMVTSGKGKLIFFSTDYIFDGKLGPYSETDKPTPINYYGKLKLECEELIRSSELGHLIIRTTGVFGFEYRRKNFFYRVFDTLSAGKPLEVPNDQFGNPTYVRDLVSAIMTLIEKKCSGTYNVVGPDCISREEFAQKIAKTFSLDEKLIVGKPTPHFKDVAPRPLNAGFKTEKIKTLGIRMKGPEIALKDMQARKSKDDVYPK